jgi:nucleotide-binding universal stress UspA family protein
LVNTKEEDAMKKIVVFIYPFEKIERIVDYAFRFAQDLNAEVEFVHAVEAAPINYEPDLDKQVPDNIATATTIGAIQEDLVQERQRILQKAISIKLRWYYLSPSRFLLFQVLTCI